MIRLAVLLTLVCCAVAAAQQPFQIGPVSARPGEVASGFLEVPAGADAGTRIPISIINGARPGSVLALFAGVHGAEYSPILALDRMRTRIDPQRLAGRVIMVHIANMPSYLKRTVYYSPVDGKNLNRVFPGKADGTVSERIAYVLTKEVIDHCDFMVDLHCGDGNESLRPYSYWTDSGRPQVDEPSRKMALAFGLDHIVISHDRPKDAAASVYASNTALTRGKPSLTIESGGLGVIPGNLLATDEHIELIERGIKNLLVHLGMVQGKVQAPERTVWLDPTEIILSPQTGVWWPVVEKGHTVAPGAVIGVVTDFFGKPLAEVKAPFSGEVLYVVRTPPTTAGEPLAMVGHAVETSPQ